MSCLALCIIHESKFCILGLPARYLNLSPLVCLEIYCNWHMLSVKICVICDDFVRSINIWHFTDSNINKRFDLFVSGSIHWRCIVGQKEWTDWRVITQDSVWYYTYCILFQLPLNHTKQLFVLYAKITVKKIRNILTNLLSQERNQILYHYWGIDAYWCLLFVQDCYCWGSMVFSGQGINLYAILIQPIEPTIEHI